MNSFIGLELSKISDAGTPSQPSTTPPRTGVGLAIVKAIVDANGGDVGASDSSAGGAVVTIRIPMAE